MAKASSNYTRRGERGTMVSSLSWFAVILAGLLLVAGGWSYFAGDTGQWREDLVGHRIPVLTSRDWQGTQVEVTHPALLYFFSDDCHFCDPARQELNEYSTSLPDHRGVPVYALAKPDFPDGLPAPRFHEGIRAVRLLSGDASLQFLRQVPIYVRTATDGSILRAYVGVAHAGELRELHR